MQRERGASLRVDDVRAERRERRNVRRRNAQRESIDRCSQNDLLRRQRCCCGRRWRRR